jgi:Tfp pilus assembly protein PilP
MRDALERYELSTLRVFLISPPRQDGSRFAYIEDPGHYLHRVEAGDYIGKADGKITEIRETELLVLEIVKVGTEYQEKPVVIKCDARCRAA